MAGVVAARLDLPQRAVELEGDGVVSRESHDVRAASGAAHLALCCSLASHHCRSRCGRGFHSTALFDWSDRPSSIRYFARVEQS